MNSTTGMATIGGLSQIVGVSAWARQIRAGIRQIAPHHSSVLISGPTGTGKELVARAIHTESGRADRPFIPVNCAAISGSLFASHMFGHVKGAFTGAHYDAQGCFRAADGGTIFLDEVGELEFDMQAKLLRALQERMIVPVGGHDPIPVNVRVITATNRNLEQEVAAGRFREDLFYRLNVVALNTAALGDRPEDIELIARHFLAKLAEENGLPQLGLSVQAIQWLQGCRWPGNVRQLENVLERAVIFARNSVIGADLLREVAAADSGAACNGFQASANDFPADLGGTQDRLPSDLSTSTPRPYFRDDSAEAWDDSSEACEDVVCGRAKRHYGKQTTEWLKLADLEKFHIRQTLEHTFYNQTAAAELLGVTFRMLARKIKNYGIDTSRSRRGRPKKNRR